MTAMIKASRVRAIREQRGVGIQEAFRIAEREADQLMLIEYKERLTGDRHWTLPPEERERELAQVIVNLINYLIEKR